MSTHSVPRCRHTSLWAARNICARPRMLSPCSPRRASQPGAGGPDEMLRSPTSGDVTASLTKTHNSFETPCGSYAHFKVTRYLVRVTRDSRYGDSMERVMYNTVLGAKPMHSEGRAFYYADYNFAGKKVYSNHIFPSCPGPLPQPPA